MQLNKKDNVNATWIKEGLFTTFTAYKQYISQNLHPGETKDVYLAVLFEWIPGHGLACAFVAGIPGHEATSVCIL